MVRRSFVLCSALWTCVAIFIAISPGVRPRQDADAERPVVAVSLDRVEESYRVYEAVIRKIMGTDSLQHLVVGRSLDNRFTVDLRPSSLTDKARRVLHENAAAQIDLQVKMDGFQSLDSKFRIAERVTLL